MSEPPGGDPPGGQEPRHSVPEDPPDRDIPLEQLLQRRVAPRVRVVQGLGLLILVAVLADLLVQALLTAPSASRGAVPTPSPAPVALGPVLVLSNVSYGAVTLNGRPLAGPLPLVTTFRRGQNTLTLTAPPFRPLICQVQWPRAYVQSSSGQGQPSCDLRRDVTVLYHVGGRAVTPVAIVDLWFSSDDLPSPERARALANVTAPLQALPLRTHVPVGDYFATGLDAQGQIRSQRAIVPLRADVLLTPTDLVSGGDTFCTHASAGSVLTPNPTTWGQIGPRWAVAAGMTLAWQFTASDGHVYHAAPYPAGHAPRLVLTYDARVGWTVDQTGTERLNGYGLPAALTLALYGTVPDLLSTVALQHGYGIAAIYDHGIEGSELQLQAVDGRNLGTVVWRFGVLLAADAPAHALLPDLPLAPPSELSAVGTSSPAQP